MSIQSEITRISGAKSDIADAIEVKGVTVPSDAMIDDMADLILQISSSGGSAVVITETEDTVHGGTILEVTAVDLSNDTVRADKLATGYTAHNSSGEAITGTMSPGGTVVVQELTVTPTTSQQTFNSSSVDGYKPVVVEAMPSGTVTAPASISGTSATVSTGTNTLTLTKTVSVTPNVSTAGYISSGTAGNSSVSLTASVTTKAAATITPTKSSQTIASGTYLTGTQTIAAIPSAYQDVTSVDAAAGDVVSGKKIVNSSGTVVTGSLVIQHYYTGSGTPSSSTGENGDIYLKTS